VLGILEAMVVGYISSAYRDMVAFFLLILVLFLRPEGLFGSYSLTGGRP
jgi:branched-subunit amino acid ABC-type transport system permease component